MINSLQSRYHGIDTRLLKKDKAYILMKFDSKVVLEQSLHLLRYILRYLRIFQDILECSMIL